MPPSMAGVQLGYRPAHGQGATGWSVGLNSGMESGGMPGYLCAALLPPAAG